MRTDDLVEQRPFCDGANSERDVVDASAGPGLSGWSLNPGAFDNLEQCTGDAFVHGDCVADAATFNTAWADGPPPSYRFSDLVECGHSDRRFAPLGLVSGGGDTAVVELTLTNTGDRDGAHVVQVYVDARACGDVVRPTRELRAFEKVYLAAGQSTVVQLRLDRRAFAFWDVELNEWVVSPGEYRVQLGHNADDIACETTVELEGDHIVRELSLESTVEEWFGHPLVAEQLFTAVNSPMIAALRQPEMLRMLGSLPMRKIVGVLGSALPPGLLTELAEQTAEAALASRAALSTV